MGGEREREREREKERERERERERELSVDWEVRRSSPGSIPLVGFFYGFFSLAGPSPRVLK